jgi:hypothetical protein
MDNLPDGHPTETTYPSRRRTTFRSIRTVQQFRTVRVALWSTA